jgi:hypothetical protein
MQFQGALIKEQGVSFAVVVVKPHIINNSLEANRMQNSFKGVFGNVPIVLMAQNSRGVPTYYGRTDIVKFLSRIHISQIPWKKYTLS